MDIIDFFRVEQTRLHSWTRIALEDLTPEEWHFSLGGNTNTIAFLVWHSVRTECQTRKAMVLVFPPRLKCHSSGVRSSRAMRVQLCKRVCSTRKKSMMSMQVSP